MKKNFFKKMLFIVSNPLPFFLKRRTIKRFLEIKTSSGETLVRSLINEWSVSVIDLNGNAQNRDLSRITQTYIAKSDILQYRFFNCFVTPNGEPIGKPFGYTKWITP